MEKGLEEAKEEKEEMGIMPSLGSQFFVVPLLVIRVVFKIERIATFFKLIRSIRLQYLI